MIHFELLETVVHEIIFSLYFWFCLVSTVLSLLLTASLNSVKVDKWNYNAGVN